MKTTMGRPSLFSADEDAIILATTSCAETNQQLRAAGFEERKCDQLKRRRHYLREEGGDPSGQLSGVERELVEAMAARRIATARLAATRAEVAEIETTLESLNRRVNELFAQVQKFGSGS